MVSNAVNSAQSSINGSASNLQDNSGRVFPSSFSAQSGAASPLFHHSGTIQGLHNMQGSFNIPNMPSTLASRNSSIGNAPSSGGVQQPSGSLSSGRFSSNNINAAISQPSHVSSHGHSTFANRGLNVVGNPGYSISSSGVGGSIPGFLSSSGGIGSRNAVPGLGVSPLLRNATPRISGSMGSIAGSGNIGRSLASGGGIAFPGLASRLNMTGKTGSGSLAVQVPNRLTSNMLQQGPISSVAGQFQKQNKLESFAGDLESEKHASSQAISLLSNSYPSGGGGLLSQNHGQAVNSLNSMGVMNDLNFNDSNRFDMNDFPQLSARPSSSGGPQGQLGSSRKQGLGVSSIAQQNQEFSIQNEDFPALPFKGGSSDFSMGQHQKEQLHDNMSMMQSQHFPVRRSVGLNIAGAYSSNRLPQQQQYSSSVSGSGVSFSPANSQELSHIHGSDMLPSSRSMYLMQSGAPPGTGLRPTNSQITVSGMNSHDQLLQQYQRQPSHPQLSVQQVSAVNQPFRAQRMMNSVQATPDAADPYGLLGLLSLISKGDRDLTSLALGIDLTTLGLNLNSAENLYKTFGSPWSGEPVRGESVFAVPQCYLRPPPPLHEGYFRKFRIETLFYIYYSMPRDEAQLYASEELMNRGWLYHKDLQMWLKRKANWDALTTNLAYERGTFICFDPNSWKIIEKENFVLQYEAVEKKPQWQHQQL